MQWIILELFMLPIYKSNLLGALEFLEVRYYFAVKI